MQDKALNPLINAIEGYENSSTKLSNLSEERVQALNYYLGKPFGNEVEGRSQVVSHDVADTIEWIKPSIMRIFASGDEIVSFDPKSQEDVEAAQQETDYCNYILTQKNSWFRTLYVWATDALMQKNGYVKAWWEDKEDVTKETYKGLSEDELAVIAQDPEVKITKTEVYDDPAYQPMPMIGPQGQMVMQAPKLYDIECKRTSAYGCVKYKEIPPERTLVGQWASSVDLGEGDDDFFEHFEWKTLSDIKAMGFDIPEDAGDEDGSFLESEEEARNLYGEPWTEEETNDPASKRYKLREVWIRYDDDEDGIAELIHCFVVGRKILEQEEVEFIPVAALTPKMMPHRHVGRSIHDEVKDIQLIKSTLLRGTLDNMYLANNGRYGVSDKVNLDDMLTSRPGGVVRVSGVPAENIFPFVHPNMMGEGLSMMEYVDQIKQNRTGVTAYVTSVDQNALNETAAGTSMLQNAAMAKIELIARVFAETGVKRLIWIIHALSLKHARKAEVIRIRNKWVTVDPRQWKNRADMTVSVGLGTGNRDQQLVHLANILTLQKGAIPLGLVEPKHLHHAASKYVQAAGFKDQESFFKVPEDNAQFQPPQDPSIAIEAQKQQAETERTLFKENEETKRTQMEIQSKEAIELARIRSSEVQAKFQAEHTERVKSAELQHQGTLKDKELGAKQQETVFHAQREDFNKAQEQAVNDPLKQFSEAAEQVIKKAESTQGQESLQVLMAGMRELVQAANAAKEIVRDASGRAVGVRPAK